MQKIIFILILCFSFGIPTIFAYSDPVNDTTVIDCITGNDDTGVAFDSTKSYQTLKTGIEKTIEYINTNINIPGNETAFSGQIFKIQVNCSANDALNNTIYLDFKGNDYHDELLIEGSGSNALVFQDVTLIQKYNMGNVIFKNAKFMNTDMPYFEDDTSGYTSLVNSNGIKIKDSIIELKNGNSIGSTVGFYPGHWGPNGLNIFYSNQQNIQNSVLRIELSGDYSFKMPTNIQNSHIIFTNKYATGISNISFVNWGYAGNTSNLNYAHSFSNEIDFGGNNVTFQDSSDISFITNSFSNFKSIVFPSQTIFLNNTIENTDAIDISNTKNMYNNAFSGAMMNASDSQNIKQNYANTQTLIKGIGWIFKRKNALPYFNVDISSYALFKTITGIDTPDIYSSSYRFFQK